MIKIVNIEYLILLDMICVKLLIFFNKKKVVICFYFLILGRKIEFKSNLFVWGYIGKEIVKLGCLVYCLSF